MILTLIQLGGLGISTLSTALFLLFGQRLETAVLLVHYLHRLNMPRILVKVANDEQAEIVKLMGATEVIQPDQHAAHNTALLIHHPRAISMLELGDGNLIVAARPPSSIVGKPASATPWLDRFGVALLAVSRADQQDPPSPPDPEQTIAETDVLILAGHIDRLRELRRMR